MTCGVIVLRVLYADLVVQPFFLTLHFAVAFSPESTEVTKNILMHLFQHWEGLGQTSWLVSSGLDWSKVLPGLSSTWWEAWRTLPLEWTQIDQLTKNPEIIEWKTNRFTRMSLKHWWPENRNIFSRIDIAASLSSSNKAWNVCCLQVIPNVACLC